MKHLIKFLNEKPYHCRFTKHRVVGAAICLKWKSTLYPRHNSNIQMTVKHAMCLWVSWVKVDICLLRKTIVIPFRLINKLVTRRSASRGDLLKNFGGVMFGGSVVGFLDALASQALIDPWCNRSKFSVDADDLAVLCLGYQPRAGNPSRKSSPFACKAWFMLRWCCGRPALPSVVQPGTIFLHVLISKSPTQRKWIMKLQAPKL